MFLRENHQNNIKTAYLKLKMFVCQVAGGRLPALRNKSEFFFQHSA